MMLETQQQQRQQQFYSRRRRNFSLLFQHKTADLCQSEFGRELLFLLIDRDIELRCVQRRSSLERRRAAKDTSTSTDDDDEQQD
mmetsp:Transcript_1697/g.2290  ORF Transcript_1697/g.2290 Transcript_1697/m.2290 type:complete len:84 (+) Transcript_1697:180-431(+)